MASILVFMLGLAFIIGQCAFFGMLALWLALRRNRIARVIGGVLVVLVAWMSIVQLINRFGGYPVTSDADINVTTIISLGLGWLAGRNRRLKASGSANGDSTTPKLIFDNGFRTTGICIAVFSQIYSILVGLLGTFVALSIVSDAVGFWGLVIGFTIAPVTFAVVPLYAGFQWHNWTPAVFCYGSMVAAGLCYAFGKLVAEQNDDSKWTRLSRPRNTIS